MVMVVTKLKIIILKIITIIISNNNNNNDDRGTIRLLKLFTGNSTGNSTGAKLGTTILQRQ